MVFGRRKKLLFENHAIYDNLDKFKEKYGFELRDVNPFNEKSVDYNLDFISLTIKQLCDQTCNYDIYHDSLIFNRFKLNIEDLQEVVENLPFQLFIPTFDKYFPDIKKVFYKEFIDNGIENTYEEVKNKIVNYADMRYIIDPMNVAINKTINYVNKKYILNNKKYLNKVLTCIMMNTWFGNKNDGSYEISLVQFFITYKNFIENSKENGNKLFWDLMVSSIISSLIIYFWYLTCNYFYNSNDKKISYIRTDVEMFYMRCIHSNSVNYTYLNELLESKKQVDFLSLNALIEYYSKYINFAKVFTNEGDEYVNLLKHCVEYKEKYTDIYKLSSEETLNLAKITNSLEKIILLGIKPVVESRKNNTIEFNAFNRLLECILDPKYNGVNMCRPSVYLDLATSDSEYIKFLDKKENK